MPWYRFTMPDEPKPAIVDMLDHFWGLLANAGPEDFTDHCIALYRSRESHLEQHTYFVHADARPFREFLQCYRAVEWVEPTEVVHVAGARIVVDQTS